MPQRKRSAPSAAAVTTSSSRRCGRAASHACAASPRAAAACHTGSCAAHTPRREPSGRVLIRYTAVSERARSSGRPASAARIAPRRRQRCCPPPRKPPCSAAALGRERCRHRPGATRSRHRPATGWATTEHAHLGHVRGAAVAKCAAVELDHRSKPLEEHVPMLAEQGARGFAQATSRGDSWWRRGAWAGAHYGCARNQRDEAAHIIIARQSPAAAGKAVALCFASSRPKPQRPLRADRRCAACRRSWGMAGPTLAGLGKPLREGQACRGGPTTQNKPTALEHKAGQESSRNSSVVPVNV